MNGLELRGISHHYGSLRAVADVSIEARSGEVLCLLGPSGCGKTTLLRIAAGLETLQAGAVTIGDTLVADSRRSLPPERRGVGLVFQDYALFPHLTVLDNVRFGLSKLDRAQQRRRALEVLARVGMEAGASAYPHTLSGGQQQRVALARALAPGPAVMLLDEPFAGLDRRLREQVREDTLRVLQQSGAAVMLVTHDPEEAMAMGDRIAIMRAGQIEQIGTPVDVYLRPATAFAAQFLGETNRLRGVVAAAAVETPLGRIPAPGQANGAEVEVMIRPEALRLEPAGSANGEPRAVVQQARLIGATTVVNLALEASELPLRALEMGPASWRPGERVAVRLDPARAFVFPLNGHA